MGLLKGMGVAMKSQPILPLYQKLAEDLKSQIEDGSLKENEKLPSELELSQEYSVSRITLRKAMEIWQRRDILSSIRAWEPLWLPGS